MNSPSKLLRALGRDCAGDVVVLEEDDPYQPPATDRYVELPDALEKIAANPFAAIANIRAEHRLSLAGGQDKVALYHDEREPIDRGWYIPLEGSPSTHIIKPQMGEHYPHLALNEYICMHMADVCGIEVARTQVIPMDVELLVVERFDRTPANADAAGGLGIYERLWQEDTCQALGFDSSQKYEQDGGPGIAQVTDLLLRYSADYLDDRMRFAKTVIFNYLIGNCDAHSKNYSLLSTDGVHLRLAPAYDLLSTSIYDGSFGSQLSRGMGMHIGAHGNIDRVDANDFEQLARDLGMSDRMLGSIADDVVARLPEAIVDAVAAVPQEATLAAEQVSNRIAAGAADRIGTLQNSLKV